MYAIRIYKENNCDKIVGVRLVNEGNLEYKDIPINDIKNMLLTQPGIIQNMELDKYNKPRLINYNPSQKQKYYSQSYKDNYVINHYCVIIGYSGGVMTFIADTENDGVIGGIDVTLGEIANMLSIKDINSIKIFNASIKQVDNKYIIDIFNNVGCHRLSSLYDTEAKDIFGSEWDVIVDSIAQNGIIVKSILHNKGVYEAVIPNGVYHIQRFKGNVNSLTLPLSVRTLGKGCFYDIDDLLEIKMSKGIKIIPENCFKDSSIKKVLMPGYEEEISESAFENCSGLRSISTCAKIIGNNAFESSGLMSVRLTGAEYIGVEAFAYNYKLHKVKLYDRLKTISGGAFRNCKHLEEIIIPASVEKIGKLAFGYCNKLKIARVHNGTLISKTAFPERTKILYY